MPTFKAYLSGASGGIGNPAPTGGQRGAITCWTANAVRRHTRWLYSIDVQQLDGQGDGVTLTLRDIPTDVEWIRLVKIFLQRVNRLPGLLRWHAVVEWQRRGAPHLHMAVYWDRIADNVHSLGRPPTSNTGVVPGRKQGRSGANRGGPGHAVVAIWRDVAGEYGVALEAQFVTPITGPLGWLQYLSKHAARGVRHYQRWGRPAGWQNTGRLWRHSRAGWPVVDPVQGELSTQQMWRLRRMVRAYAVASARADALRYERCGDVGKAKAAWRRVSYLRRAGKDPDRCRSSVRGFSEWVPAALLLPMAALAGWDGTLKET